MDFSALPQTAFVLSPRAERGLGNECARASGDWGRGGLKIKNKETDKTGTENLFIIVVALAPPARARATLKLLTPS